MVRRADDCRYRHHLVVMPRRRVPGLEKVLGVDHLGLRLGEVGEAVVARVGHEEGVVCRPEACALVP
jgi:hypothetical protein